MKFLTINNKKCVISKISDYLAFTIDGKEFYSKKFKGKILKEWTLLNKMKTGSAAYYAISTPIGKKYAHRVICETFHKKIRYKNTVNHKDMNVHNNNPNNLEWVSQSENIKHALAKTKPKKIIINGKEYYHYTEAAKVLKLNRHIVRNRCLSKTFKNYKLIVWKKK